MSAAASSTPEAPVSEELTNNTQKNENSVLELKAGTPILLMLNSDISTQENVVGDQFGVTVLNDILIGDKVAIPKGTSGIGDVTFVTKNGGFGKAGIIAISVRHLDVGGTRVALDGRYREEGKGKTGVAGATWFAVGIFSGFVRGKDGIIPAGRELKARIRDDVALPFEPEAPISSDTADTIAPHPDPLTESPVPMASVTATPDPE